MSSWRRPQSTAGEMAFLCWLGNASVPSGEAGGGGQLRLQSGLGEAPETGCNKKKKKKLKRKRKKERLDLASVLCLVGLWSSTDSTTDAQTL